MLALSFSLYKYIFLCFQSFESRLHGSYHFTPQFQYAFHKNRNILLHLHSSVIKVTNFNTDAKLESIVCILICQYFIFINCLSYVFHSNFSFSCLGSCIAFRCHLCLIPFNLEQLISFSLSIMLWIFVKNPTNSSLSGILQSILIIDGQSLFAYNPEWMTLGPTWCHIWRIVVFTRPLLEMVNLSIWLRFCAISPRHHCYSSFCY